MHSKLYSLIVFGFFWKAQVTNIIFVCLLQQHKIETANLLNNLKQKDEKIREERKRQLGMLNEKRERLHNAGKTPRTTPAPAAASKRKSWQYKPVAGTCFLFMSFRHPAPPTKKTKSYNAFIQYLHMQINFFIWTFRRTKPFISV